MCNSKIFSDTELNVSEDLILLSGEKEIQYIVEKIIIDFYIILNGKIIILDIIRGILLKILKNRYFKNIGKKIEK